MAFALFSLPVCVCLLACVHTSVWPLCVSTSAPMPIYVYRVCQCVLECLVDSACLLVYISSVYLLRAQDSLPLLIGQVCHEPLSCLASELGPHYYDYSDFKYPFKWRLFTKLASVSSLAKELKL